MNRENSSKMHHAQGTARQRPPRTSLKYDLHSDDVLFFMHIPKTGGLTLIKILDQQYPPEQICPLHSDPDGDLFPAYSPERLAGFRLVHGHFRFGPYDSAVWRYLTPNPVRITLLREPVARILSAYHHNIRKQHIPLDTSLMDFVCGEEYHKRVWNNQTRWLAGVVRGNLGFDVNEETLPEDALLFLAKENLRQLVFFGITERFEQSMQMLCYTFGWDPITNIPRENSAPEPTDIAALDPQVREAIEQRNQLDMELYTIAQRHFERRYRQMVDEIAVNSEMPAADATGFDAWPLERSPAVND